LFDGTGSTVGASGTQPFHDLHYEFNFDDNEAGTWTHSGLSKNSQGGSPLAAYVFERPGTYTVRMRVEAPNGQFSQTSTTVTVLNPSSHYAGTRTVCVSTTANYAGCPSGAAQQTALPTTYAGKRVLLRRGESFPTINVRHQDDDVQVGAFGTGAKPRVASVQIGAGRATTANFPDEVTIMDLDVANGIEQTGPTSRLLLLRNDLDDPGARNEISFGAALGYWAESDPYRVVPTSAFYHPREIFIVENRVIGSTSSNAATVVNLYGGGSRMAILGNDMGQSAQHTVRLYAAHKTVIAHNALRGRSADGVRHALKLHSGGLGSYADSFAVSRGTWVTQQVAIANNLFGDPQDNNSWNVAIRPQNAGSGEGIEDVIVENNRFHRGPNTNTDVLIVGRRLGARGNTRATGGTGLNISTDSSTSYPLPGQWVGPYYIR